MKKRTLRLTLVMLLLGCVPMLCFAVFSYQSITRPLRERQSAYNVQSLTQNANAVERVLYNASVAMDYFIQMSRLQEAMHLEMTGQHFQTYQELKKELIRLQPFESMEANACLIAIRQGWLINNSGLYRLSESENRAQYQDYIDGGYTAATLSYFPQNHNQSSAIYDSFFNDNAIHMIKSIPQGRSRNAMGLLAVKIPCSYLSRMLAVESGLGTMLVLDKNMCIIANNDKSRIGESLSNEAYIQSVASYGSNSGSFDIHSASLGDISVSFRFSDYNGWLYLLLSPQSNLIKEFSKLSLTILSICCCFFVILLIGSSFASKKTYKPLSSIVDHLSTQGDYPPGTDPIQYISASIGDMLQRQRTLMAELSMQEQPIREYTVISLLQGSLTSEGLERRRKMMPGVHEQWIKVVAVMQLHPKVIEENIESAGMLMVSIRQTVAETMSKELALTPVLISNTLCVILTFPQIDPAEMNSRTKLAANQMLGLLDRSDEMMSTVGIGSPFTRLEDANRSYREAVSALSYSFFSGGEAILFYDNRTMTRAYRPQIYLQTQAQLLAAVKSADEAEATRLLDQFFSDISREAMSRNEYIIPLLNLLTELIALCQGVSSDFIPQLENGRSIYDDFISISTRGEMYLWLLERMIKPYIATINRMYNAQQRKLVKRVQELIDTQFDKGLTLESCAAELNYHSAHIRKVFQQLTGRSFSDCLSQRRLEAAKEWLLSTDMKIQDIAERLDYSNSQNFIRYFRAYTGETPGTFRKRNQNANANAHDFSNHRKDDKT